jgi:hypothetical protein
VTHGIGEYKMTNVDARDGRTDGLEYQQRNHCILYRYAMKGHEYMRLRNDDNAIIKG